MKFYKVQLSNKTEIEIDENDFENVKKGIGSGGLVKVKQAIINPSFVVAIIPIEKKEVKKVTGHFDEEKGVYVVDTEEMIDPTLKDGFVQENNLLDDGN